MDARTPSVNVAIKRRLSVILATVNVAIEGVDKAYPQASVNAAIEKA